MLGLSEFVSKQAFKVFDAIGSVADVVDIQMPAYGDRIAIRYDDGEQYRALSFAEYVGNVRRMVRFFERVDTDRQHIVCTFCKNRPEWDMTALAVFYTGNILFPLDTKMNEVELLHLLSHNPPDFLLVAHAQLQRMRDILARLGQEPVVVVADYYMVFEDQGIAPLPLRANERSLSSWVRESSLSGHCSPSPRLANPDTVLGEYATSGTTSLPKIVQISHGNIVAEVNEAIDVLNLRINEEMLNIGPYTHIATLVEFLVTKTRGFAVTYFTREPDEDDVLEDEIRKLKGQGVRIKALLAVPKFWIYVLKEILEEMKNKPVFHNLYRHLISIEKHDKLYDISSLDKAKLSAVRMFLRNKLGGYFSYGISSSTKLDGALVEIFGKLGVTVIDIYGATEASGIISRNKLNDIHPGTCGRMIPLLDYKVVDAHAVPGLWHSVGELMIKGPTISPGYVGEPPGSHLDADGYYSTGDLVYVDEERIVRLVGRRKELMLWEDGTYVDPMHLSNLLVRSIFVKDALVARLSKEDAFLSVFILPDYKRIKKDPSWIAEIATGVGRDQALRNRLEEAIDYAQSIARITPRLSTERIYILARPLERTPTHKIKFVFELEKLETDRFV